LESSSPAKAKLFVHGGSQAVRLPKEFRFGGTEVFVRRQGEDVVLSARPRAPMRSLIDALAEFDPTLPIARDQPARADQRAPVGREASRR
jgi:antitoxin VapB